MGAHPYQYVVEYDEDVQAALDRLRADVFRNGRFFGAERNPRTPEQAVKQTGETGTRSILDIVKIRDKPDYCCAAGLTPSEVKRYFGTDRPTVATVEASDKFWEDLERGKARFVVVYEGEEKKIFFAGYSFD
ncbi:MAG: hypothetical protein OEX18_15580 [Candidatus Krumholzibacteria bacterium]|nr:hypothetical protein [Candidatus Krumholzibacteria bacterium]MDH5271006.1 hypothetical protein [Candidatus Krumholzibacteria bacterium]